MLSKFNETMQVKHFRQDTQGMVTVFTLTSDCAPGLNDRGGEVMLASTSSSLNRSNSTSFREWGEK